MLKRSPFLLTRSFFCFLHKLRTPSYVFAADIQNFLSGQLYVKITCVRKLAYVLGKYLLLGVEPNSYQQDSGRTNLSKYFFDTISEYSLHHLSLQSIGIEMEMYVCTIVLSFKIQNQIQLIRKGYSTVPLSFVCLWGYLF